MTEIEPYLHHDGEPHTEEKFIRKLTNTNVESGMKPGDISAISENFSSGSRSEVGSSTGAYRSTRWRCPWLRASYRHARPNPTRRPTAPGRVHRRALRPAGRTTRPGHAVANLTTTAVGGVR